MILKLKNGSGIHIKKKNRGKFTEYCGGTVTSECIARGKRSSNPAIRKRATFAANARRWKHKSGGSFVKGVNILDSNPDAYKDLKKKLTKALQGIKIGLWFSNNLDTIGNIVGSGISALSKSVQNANYSKKFDETTQALIKAMKRQAFNEAYQKALQILPYLNNGEENQSDIVNSKRAWDYANNLNFDAEIQKYLLDRLLEKLNTLAIQGGFDFGSLFQTGLGALGNWLGNKTSTDTISTNTPIMKDYSKDFILKTLPGVNDMKLKMAFLTKDHTFKI